MTETKRPQVTRALIVWSLCCLFIGSVTGALIATAVVTNDLTINPSVTPSYSITLYKYNGGCTGTVFTQSAGTGYQFCIFSGSNLPIYYISGRSMQSPNVIDTGGHNCNPPSTVAVYSPYCTTEWDTTCGQGAQAGQVWEIDPNQETLVNFAGSCGNRDSVSMTVICEQNLQQVITWGDTVRVFTDSSGAMSAATSSYTGVIRC